MRWALTLYALTAVSAVSFNAFASCNHALSHAAPSTQRLDIDGELSRSLQQSLYFWYFIFDEGTVIRGRTSLTSPEFKKILGEMVDFAIKLESASSRNDARNFLLLSESLRRQNERWQAILSNESLQIFSQSIDGIPLRILRTPGEDAKNFYVLAPEENFDPRHSHLENWISVVYKILFELVAWSQISESVQGESLIFGRVSAVNSFLRGLEVKKLLDALDAEAPPFR